MTSTSASPKPESVSANAKPRLSHVWTREGSDFYIEPHWVSARLFEIEDFGRDQTLLDACCGTGRIATSAKAAGYTVIAADIVDRGYPGTHVQDFLQRQSAPPTVVCNPPFGIVRAFANHALNLGARKVALIFPTARLNAARWLQDLPLRKVLALSPRPSMPPGHVLAAGGRAAGGKTDFVWLVFQRGFTGAAELGWLHRDGAAP